MNVKQTVTDVRNTNIWNLKTTQKSIKKLNKPVEGRNSPWYKLANGEETNCAGGAIQSLQFIL